jgi:hypothetical protein
MLGDARGLYPRLTARENIVYYGRLHGMTRAAAEARAEARPSCWRCAAAGPPHRGLQPGRAHEDRAGPRAGARPAQHHPGRAHQRPGRAGHALLRDALRRLRDEQGKCIVFSTHIMQEVERLCDQVVVISPWPHGGARHGGRAAAAHRADRLRGDLRVALAFPDAPPDQEAARVDDPNARTLNLGHRFWKELLDALRDRRTLRWCCWARWHRARWCWCC